MSEPTPDAAKYRADLAIDALFRDAGETVAAAVRRHARDTPDGPRLDDVGRRLVMDDAEAVLGPLYGRRRGDPGQVGVLVVRHAAAAYAGVLRSTADGLRERLAGAPEVLALLEGA